MRNKNIIRIAIGTGLILMIPLIAMQFSNEVVWTLFDFVFMGILLFGTGLIYELVAKRMNNFNYRAAVGVAVVTGFLLVWINAAAGIIGSEGSPANVMYFGVLILGAAGALIARLEARAMAYTLFTMAAAQALVPVAALMTWGSYGFAPSVLKVFTLNAFFVVAWIVSGVLFLHAARKSL